MQADEQVGAFLLRPTRAVAEVNEAIRRARQNHFEARFYEAAANFAREQKIVVLFELLAFAIAGVFPAVPRVETNGLRRRRRAGARRKQCRVNGTRDIETR